MIMAAKEKDRLEKKQRAARKEREKNKIEYHPAYFKTYQNPEDDQEYFVYNGKYFEEDRKNQKWDNQPDLFSENDVEEE